MNRTTEVIGWWLHMAQEVRPKDAAPNSKENIPTGHLYFCALNVLWVRILNFQIIDTILNYERQDSQM